MLGTSFVGKSIQDLELLVRLKGASSTVPRLLASRTGQNGAFGGYTTVNFNGVVQTQHLCPYGADQIQLVYAGYALTQGSGKAEAPIQPSVWRVSAGTLVVAGGGGGYAVGDTVTGPTANAVSVWIGRVIQVSAGAITKMAIIRAGFYFGTAPPADGMAQSATSGAGTLATFNAQWDGGAAGAHLSITVGFPPPAPILMIGSGASELVDNGSPNADVTESWDLLFPAGDVFISAPIGIDVPKGSLITIRGEIVSMFASTGRTPLANEFSAIGNSFFERANAGSLTTSQANNFFQPAAIIGISKSDGPRLLMIGDSRAFGFVGATVDPGDANGNVGWIERACTTQFPYANHARGSMLLGGYMNITPPASGRWGISQVIRKAIPSSVYLNLSINDFIVNATPAATLQSWEAQMVSILRGLGVKQIWTDTTDPNTTSTDGWTTLVNQTITGAGALAVTRNTLLRTLGAQAYAGYDFFIDQAGVTEDISTGAPSGKWAIYAGAATTDGTHADQTYTVLKATNAIPILALNLR